MKNFNQGDRFKSSGRGGNRGFDKREARGGFGGDRQTFQAVCAECGKKCEVPFKPTGDKPVYCNACFGKQHSSSNSRFDKREARGGFGERQSFHATCAECGDDCEVPFRPTGDKPVYCSNCFGKADKGRGSKTVNSEHYEKQFAELNAKLDHILTLLSPAISSKKIKPVNDSIEIFTEAEAKAKKDAKPVKKAKVAKKEPKAKKAVTKKKK